MICEITLFVGDGCTRCSFASDNDSDYVTLPVWPSPPLASALCQTGALPAPPANSPPDKKLKQQRDWKVIKRAHLRSGSPPPPHSLPLPFVCCNPRNNLSMVGGTPNDRIFLHCQFSAFFPTARREVGAALPSFVDFCCVWEAAASCDHALSTQTFPFLLFLNQTEKCLFP